MICYRGKDRETEDHLKKIKEGQRLTHGYLYHTSVYKYSRLMAWQIRTTTDCHSEARTSEVNYRRFRQTFFIDNCLKSASSVVKFVARNGV